MSSIDQAVQVYQLRIWIREISPPDLASPPRAQRQYHRAAS